LISVLRPSAEMDEIQRMEPWPSEMDFPPALENRPTTIIIGWALFSRAIKKRIHGFLDKKWNIKCLKENQQ